MIMEIYAAGIVLVGFGVMFRIVRLRTAIVLIGLAVFASVLRPASQTVAVWVFVGIIGIFALVLAGKFAGTVLGKEAEKSWWDRVFSLAMRYLTRRAG